MVNSLDLLCGVVKSLDFLHGEEFAFLDLFMVSSIIWGSETWLNLFIPSRLAQYEADHYHVIIVFFWNLKSRQ